MTTGYRPQSRDTSATADRLMIEAYRRMPPWEKAERVSHLTRASQELALAGIRERHPGAPVRELRLRLAAFRLPREIMIRLFGWDPAREGY
ncbi:MAG: hypothetical protein ABIH26_02290 [Candidatus Eisenbacteria bacterium]